jgi:hypothetical protein
MNREQRLPETLLGSRTPTLEEAFDVIDFLQVPAARTVPPQ